MHLVIFAVQKHSKWPCAVSDGTALPFQRVERDAPHAQNLHAPQFAWFSWCAVVRVKVYTSPSYVSRRLPRPWPLFSQGQSAAGSSIVIVSNMPGQLSTVFRESTKHLKSKSTTRKMRSALRLCQYDDYLKSSVSFRPITSATARWPDSDKCTPSKLSPSSGISMAAKAIPVRSAAAL